MLSLLRYRIRTPSVLAFCDSSQRRTQRLLLLGTRGRGGRNPGGPFLPPFVFVLPSSRGEIYTTERKRQGVFEPFLFELPAFCFLPFFCSTLSMCLFYTTSFPASEPLPPPPPPPPLLPLFDKPQMLFWQKAAADGTTNVVEEPLSTSTYCVPPPLPPSPPPQPLLTFFSQQKRKDDEEPQSTYFLA